MSAGVAMAGRKLQLAVWNARAALLYSLGGWTILGGMLHYTKNHGGGESGDAAGTGDQHSIRGRRLRSSRRDVGRWREVAEGGSGRGRGLEEGQRLAELVSWGRGLAEGVGWGRVSGTLRGSG